MGAEVYLLLNHEKMPGSIMALMLEWGKFNTCYPQFGNFSGKSDNRSIFQPPIT